ncbi:MAG: phosphatase PAP2 family protein, partial [Bacteroidota bacterium]
MKKVDTEEKADRVISHLEAATAGTKAADVAKEEPPAATPAEAAGKVEQAAESAQGTKKTEKVLETTARVLVTPADKRQKEVVSEAAQEVLNPQQQGAAPTVTDETQRDLLRKAVLKRLKPLDAVDAQGFLAVNHLPHTHLLNSLFYGLTLAYMGGAAWYAAMAAAALRKPRSAGRLFREVAVPLTVTGVLVEYPIKTYFKRRRPFISIIQAIVIGKKPGSWSFPSGHSAMAFGGAWLLNKRFPKFAGLTYTLASLVAFSRIYLGDHYP